MKTNRLGNSLPPHLTAFRAPLSATSTTLVRRSDVIGWLRHNAVFNNISHVIRPTYLIKITILRIVPRGSHTHYAAIVFR